MTRRRLAVALTVCVLLLVGADTGLWFLGTGVLRRYLEATVAARRAEGWTVDYRPPTAAGWPLRAALVVPDLHMTIAGEPTNPLTWSASEVTLELALTQPRRIVIRVAGRQAVGIAGMPPVGMIADRTTVEIPFAGTPGAGSVDIAIAGLHADLPVGTLTLARLNVHAEDHKRAAVGARAAMTLDGEGIDLPAAMPGGGGRIEALHLALSLTGSVPADGTPAARASAWRDEGGVVALDRLTLAWGGAHLDASGRVMLDAALQPVGDAKVRLAGLREIVAGLVASGAMPQRSAGAAVAVLSLMARPDPAGGPPVVEVPLVLKDRVLAMGRIPLLRVPALDWSGAN